MRANDNTQGLHPRHGQNDRAIVLPRYARMTRQVEALIASAYLSGTNTRRVKRALGALFKGAVARTSSVGCGAS